MFNFYRATSNDFPAPSRDSYCAQVRAAHALADMLKRTRPHLFEQVESLQTTIRNCQERLDHSQEQAREAKRCSDHDGHAFSDSPALPTEARTALQELDEATQALLDLRHKGQLAK